MKAFLALLVILLISASQASVTQTLSSLDRSLDRRLAELKSTLESNMAARKKSLVIPFENYKKTKAILEKVLAEVKKNGDADKKKYLSELAGLKKQRDTIQTMKNLNAGISNNHKKQKSAIVIALEAMLAQLNIQIKADEEAYEKRVEKRAARKTLATSNNNAAKKTYDDLVAQNNKANKSEQDAFNKEESKINKEKANVELAEKALREAEKKSPERIVRYVKIVNTKSYLQLAEVEVFNARGINVALHMPTKQSSTGWGGVSSNAVDGNTNGQWGARSTTHTAGKGWWEVDLKRARTVASVKVYNRLDCCNNRLSGSKVYLLDSKRKVVKKFTLSGTKRVQTFKVGNTCTC